MIKTHYVILLLLFAGLNSPAQSLMQKSNHRPGEILFQPNDNFSDFKILFAEIFKRNDFIQSAENYAVHVISKNMNFYKVSFDPSVFNENEILKSLVFNKNIKNAQFNHILEQRNTEPDDPIYKDQWALRRIVAPAVWDITQGGKTPCGDTIVVGVLDLGFDINHSDLRANIWKNAYEVPNNGIDDDKNGYIDDYAGFNASLENDRHDIMKHGTQCAGVIGATGNNTLGVAGINWNVKLLIVSGCYGEEEMIKGYDYLLEMRKKYNQSGGKQGAFVAVSSMSLGFKQGIPDDFPLTCAVYDRLGEAGILNVVACDNVAADLEKYGDVPALCPSENLIVVTRTDSRDALPDAAGYSSTSVDLAAPGQDVSLLSLNNGYAVDRGNSFAAPLVAGSAALMLSLPSDTICKMAKIAPKQVVGILKDVIMKGVDANIFLKDKTVSGGRLNLYKSSELLIRMFGANVGNYNISKMYPNPVNRTLSIELTLPANPNVDLVVSNMLGQVVYQKHVEDIDLLKKTLTISTEGLAPGVYYLSILADKFKTSKSFMVAHP